MSTAKQLLKRPLCVFYVIISHEYCRFLIKYIYYARRDNNFSRDIDFFKKFTN